MFGAGTWQTWRMNEKAPIEEKLEQAAPQAYGGQGPQKCYENYAKEGGRHIYATNQVA